VAERGIDIDPGGIIVTTGSQECLDNLGKILISKGDFVAVEGPTYLAAFTAFNPYQPQYVTIETDKDGVIPESLEEILSEHSVKFVYLIPTFQNPSGRTIPMARRRQIAEIIIRHDALLVEDDPYGALRYRGKHLPPIKTLAPNNVAYLSTLSKLLSPGLRLGFCIAPPTIQKWVVLAKQGVNLHTSSFDQALAAEYIAAGYLKRQLPKIIELYAPRLDAMLAGLERYFPKSFTWSKPEGGMFVWAEGPPELDATALYWKAIERKVAYVPGEYFYADGSTHKNTTRLNFTMSDEAALNRALKTLGEVVTEALQNSSQVRPARSA
jgi:2-aminoadipate transaminase